MTDLKEETSPSRVAFKLETGDLVVDVKKLNRDLLLWSNLNLVWRVFEVPVRTVRKFRVYRTGGTEGKGWILGCESKSQECGDRSKGFRFRGWSGRIECLGGIRKMDLAKAVADSQESASEYDLTRLANTVEGYAPKPNYIVKSAHNMELIWCPPGSFIMEIIRKDNEPAHPVILTKGFYLGKYEVTQEEYKKSWAIIPASLKEKNCPLKC